MSFGLKIWDSQGNLILDTNRRITRFNSAFELVIPKGNSVIVNIPGYSNDGTWAYFLSTISGIGACNVSINGSKFTIFNVDYSNPTTINLTILRI